MSAEAIDHALQALLGRPTESPPLTSIRLRPSRSDEVRASTSGEVVRAQTLSFETLEPIEGGLFCEQLFGPLGAEAPTRDARARALASPLLRAKEDDVIAPRDRMERFARVSLAMPSEHPLLGRPGWSERLADAGLDEWTIEVLPVLPPDLRAIVPVQEGDRARFMVSDLNDLYRQVLGANARLARLRERRAAPSLIELEASKLGEAIAQLVDNPSMREPRAGPSGRPLAGLLGMLAHPARPVWPTLAELDGMVARGVVRHLGAPLAKRTLLVLSYLRALAVTVEIVLPAEGDTATVH